MSYILEALKKAQAERQLGSAPTLHAPTLHGAEQKASGGVLRKPLLLSVLAMGVAIVVLLVLVLRPARQQPATGGQPVAATAPEPAVVASAVPAAAPASSAAAPFAPAASPVAPVAVANAPAAALAVPASASARSQQGGAPSSAALPPPVATVTPVPHPRPAPDDAKPAPAAGAVAAADTTAKPAAVAVEEPVQNLRDLPEPIQRSIPRIAVGGYIYSKNPADRLLLIDKILRHEGEEVAPGLTLEKLQPREAVFNFKGYRYRVPY